MTNDGVPRAGGAQFFIYMGDNTLSFNPEYSVLGLVASGLDVARAIKSKVKIISITITTTP
jgi:cyclophilin family peptidyl-prolyl cis-trans isomerase